MATHSNVPAWRIPGKAEPGGLPSMGSYRVGYDWSDLAAAAVTKQLANLPKKSRVGEQMGTRSIILPPILGKNSQMCLRSFWALTLLGVPASMPPAMGCDVWARYLCEQLLLLEKNWRYFGRTKDRIGGPVGKQKQLNMVLGPFGLSSSRYHLGNTPFFIGESTLMWGWGGAFSHSW